MRILHKTKGNAPINAKQQIFIHAAESDRKERDSVIQMILNSENGGDYAVLFADGPAFPVDFSCPELARITLYVPIITESFLEQCDRSMDFQQLSVQKGFDILPVVKNSDLIPAYNERFKNTHAVTLTMKDPALEIEKQLARMLVSAELIEEIIRDGFTRRLFLSYRKKDAAEVERIMRAVHKTKWAKAAAIWFDDYLVPGTDFENGISDAMKEADAVIIAVTGNLPKPNDEGKKNYVCDKEYPDAVKQQKPCIAIETEPTSREELDEALGKDFPKCIPVDNAEQMDRAFDQLGGEEPEPDPYVQYLRAMAYLLGVRVEKDPKKAMEMLDDCVGRGVYEAAMQLSSMYAVGISCHADLKTAVEYRQKAYDIVMRQPLDRQKLDRLSAIVLGDEKYSSVTIGGTVDKADEYYEAFANEIKAYLKTGVSDTAEKDVLYLYLADAYTRIGSIENREFDAVPASPLGFGKDTHKIGVRKSFLIMAEKQLDNVSDKSTDTWHRCYAQYYSICSSMARFEDNWALALEYAQAAVGKQRFLVRYGNATYMDRWMLATYTSNVIGCEFMKNGARPGSIDEKAAKDSLDQFESLYAEKKDPVLAMELISCYDNMKLTTRDKKKQKEYMEQALKRLHEVERDFPHLHKEVQMKDAELNRSIQNSNWLTGLSPNPLKSLLTLLLLGATITLFIIGSGYMEFNLALKIIGAIGMGLLTLSFCRFKPAWRLMIDIVGAAALYFGFTVLSANLGFDNNTVHGIVMYVIAMAAAIF